VQKLVQRVDAAIAAERWGLALRQARLLPIDQRPGRQEKIRQRLLTDQEAHVEQGRNGLAAAWLLAADPWAPRLEDREALAVAMARVLAARRAT